MARSLDKVLADLEALAPDVAASLERVGKAGDEERGAELGARLDVLSGELVAAARDLGSFVGATVAMRRFGTVSRARAASVRAGGLVSKLARQVAAASALRLLATIDSAKPTTPGDLEALELGRARVDELLELDGVRELVEARRGRQIIEASR